MRPAGARKPYPSGRVHARSSVQSSCCAAAFLSTPHTTHHTPQVSSFFFVLSIFANTFILLNLTRAVVIFTYAKTDKQFWRKQPDDVTNDPFPNPLDFPREVYQRVTGFSMRRNLKKMRKKEYQGELKERKTRAREEAKEAVEEEIARQKALDEAKANPENGENGEEAENGGNGKA